MCAKRSWHQPAGESPARENRPRPEAVDNCDRAVASRYRVLRAVLPRGIPRSVDRECAGRNATSVKVVEPRQTDNFRGGRASMRKRRQHRPSQTIDTTGVQDHGMYTRLMSEPGRSRRSPIQGSGLGSKVGWQGVMTESVPTILRREVRCVHSSKEAE